MTTPSGSPEKYSWGSLLVVALAIVGFFLIVNLIGGTFQSNDTPPTPERDLVGECIASIPDYYSDSMKDDAVETCLMIGSTP